MENVENGIVLMEKPEINIEPKLIGDLLDIIYNATIIIDADHRIIFANTRTAAMFRTEANFLTGLDFRDLFTEEDTSILAPNIITLTRQNYEFEGESLFKRRDGTTFLGLIAGTYFSWNNENEGMAFTINDISTMKTLERSLKKTERIAFLGRLVNDISHQIRNPVMVIGGFARRLQKKYKDTKDTQAILDESVRLENLLDTLNRFVSLPSPKPVSIKSDTFFDHVEAHLKEKIEEQGCTWVSTLENCEEEVLLVDQPLLLEALEAVVNNACESYNPREQEKVVRFALKHSPDPQCPILIEISDQGSGIREQSFQKVFSHFYTEKTRHIGMGLTFAQRIIDEQKGKITLESTFGSGTKVSLHLPKERRREIRTRLLNP